MNSQLERNSILRAVRCPWRIRIPFELGTGFVAGDTKRVKTPGEVWGLEIREDDADPARRTLLVADSYGGNRVYSLGSIYDQPASGQQ